MVQTPQEPERQPLTTPRASPEPEGEPVIVTTDLDHPTTIQTSTFYPSAKKALQRRTTDLTTLSSGLGSSHTTYYPPVTAPPPTRPHSLHTPSPLVNSTAWQSTEEEDIPPLIPDETDWGVSAPRTTWDAWPTESHNTWGQGWNHQTYTATGVKVSDVNEYEANAWWDKTVRDNYARPGPGMLSTLLVERVLDHLLLEVAVAYPDPLPHATPVEPGYEPPSPTELQSAIPHPHAYYCRQLNSWVLLRWTNSDSKPLPRVSDGLPYPLPSEHRRMALQDCLTTSPYSEHANKTHHFHFYAGAVSTLELDPPYSKPSWQEHSSPTDADGQAPPGEAMDMYICCGCSAYVLVGATHIPGVVAPDVIAALVKDRGENPLPGLSRSASVVAAFELLLRILYNVVWSGDGRTLKTSGKTITRKLGWNKTVEALFSSLGYRVNPNDADGLIPPAVDPSTDQGRQGRAKMLRAWVEIQAWMVDYLKRNVSDLKEYNLTYPPSVVTSSIRDTFTEAIGAHSDQVQPGILPAEFREITPRESWERLGLQASTFSPERLEFAYRAQIRCDPADTPIYFGHLSDIVTQLENLGPGMQDMGHLLAMEQSRGRWRPEDLEKSIALLGFGSDNTLRVDIHEVEDEFVESAWADAMKRAWREDEKKAIEHRAALRDAFRIVAESRGSKSLKRIFDASDKLGDMTPEKAYSTLEVPRDVAEDMLITVYTMRVEDQPSQLDKMREALRVIAELTDSDRLRNFLETGRDDGEPPPVTRPEWPRGLNQLGNTCYLNSLLQYFYTIKDLRDAMAPTSFAELDKLTDADIQQHRVGGRSITRREIERSRQFVQALSGLFFDLEWSEQPAITPSIELAKLALVTSKDEEEEELEKKAKARDGTESSNSTDATLVDEPAPSQPPAKSKSHSPPPSSSVLGKRPRDAAMEVETDRPPSPMKSPQPDDGFVIVSKPSTTRTVVPLTPMDKLTRSLRFGKHSTADQTIPTEEEDVEMKDANPPATETPADPPKKEEADGSKEPPPLPPRTKPASESVMMFGKQHDVAEAMDNIMFQIETALLPLDDKADPGTSVVKRLFYGKIRQRITIANQLLKPVVHEREDLFSHLPVNVSEEGYDIYDGLSGYFDDNVEYEGEKARMEVSLVDLPPILQIQLQRAQFNRETLQPYKSHAYVKFGETIFIDRFLDNVNPDKRAQAKAVQAELAACRDRLHALTQGQGAAYTTMLENTAKFLRSPDMQHLFPGDAVAFELERAGADLKQELVDIRARASALKQQLEEIWQDEHEAEYELTSVFIHRGSSPTFGHYFFYARHLPDNPDSWFKYNDSEVSVVTKDEVLADTTGSTANPYLLVYARKGSAVVQTVQRNDPTLIEQAEEV